MRRATPHLTSGARRAALAALLALGVAGCAASAPPLRPLDPTATPTPDDLLRRIIAVAQAETIRDPMVSERLLGLRWDEVGDLTGPLRLAAKSRPPWLGNDGPNATATLIASPLGSPPRRPVEGGNVWLRLVLNLEVVCISPRQVADDLAVWGEWRKALVSHHPSIDYFAMRPDERPNSEVRFTPGAPGRIVYPGPANCIVGVSIYQ